MANKLLVLTVLIIFAGCDSQSPNATYINNLGVGLYNTSSDPYQAMDYWAESGQYIYSGAFGYICFVGQSAIKLKGIKICCKVTDHYDPIGGDDDIWDKPAPCGEQYGFIEVIPEGTWNPETGIACGRTDETGKIGFFVGLGDPQANMDSGYLWPDVVTTKVELEFILPKYNGSLKRTGGATFLRAQYQGFWEPYGGVYGNSWSYINQATQSMQSETAISPPESNNEPLQEMLIEDSNGWAYWGCQWQQLVFSGYGWYWTDYLNGFVPLWFSAGEWEPNEAVELASAAEPYSLWSYAQVNDVNVSIVGSRHTTLMIVRTEDGNEVSTCQIKNKIRSYDDEIGTVTMSSDFIIPVENPNETGICLDDWNNVCMFVYVPENGYVELMPDPCYGDFNFDGVVTGKDFAALAAQYGTSLMDPNYDMLYDATKDGWTDINDIIEFADKWLLSRE